MKGASRYYRRQIGHGVRLGVRTSSSKQTSVPSGTLFWVPEMYQSFDGRRKFTPILPSARSMHVAITIHSTYLDRGGNLTHCGSVSLQP
jgi:hypothetical protein